MAKSGAAGPRVEFGSNATLASDPIVGLGTRFTARLQALAGGEGRIVLLVAASIVAVAVVASLWQLRRRRPPAVAISPTITSQEK